MLLKGGGMQSLKESAESDSVTYSSGEYTWKGGISFHVLPNVVLCLLRDGPSFGPENRAKVLL